jgi:transposase
MRGVLLEYGLCMPAGKSVVIKQLPSMLEDADNGLPIMSRHILSELKAEYKDLIRRIARLEDQLKAWHRQNALSQRLETIPGVGLLTATALSAAVGDGREYSNGRQLAAHLGLVPRQASSGGKHRPLGISKRGDSYLRGLLIHGARAVIRQIRCRLKAGQTGDNPWVEQLLEGRHPNEVAVALANKMARISWVLMAREETYRSA